MSFSSLLNHTVRIHRPFSTPGALGEEVRGYLPVGDVPATCKRPVAVLTDVGPGVAASGEQVWYLEAGVDVRERDVLEVIAGPEAGRVVEVDGPVTRPRGHHTELRCRVFNGLLVPGQEGS